MTSLMRCFFWAIVLVGVLTDDVAGLVDVACELGFHRVETIDDDLGISGSGFAERPGFQRRLTTHKWQDGQYPSPHHVHWFACRKYQ